MNSVTRTAGLTALAWTVLGLAACSEAPLPSATGEVDREQEHAAPQAPPDRMVTYTEEREPCADYSATRKPLFGDVHVHTSFSFDAAANGTGAGCIDKSDFMRSALLEACPRRRRPAPIPSSWASSPPRTPTLQPLARRPRLTGAATSPAKPRRGNGCSLAC